MGHASFESHVQKIRRPQGCWLWDGSTDWKGYGVYARRRAHHRTYEMFVGPIPKGKILRHTCDTPACVRPDHLVPGTQAENSQDMKDRDRQARGERHSQVKLTEATVRDIRKMIGYGFRQSAIARLVGVDPSTVSDIKRGKSWGWL